jgi:hypothetical protein
LLIEFDAQLRIDDVSHGSLLQIGNSVRLTTNCAKKINVQIQGQLLSPSAGPWEAFPSKISAMAIGRDRIPSLVEKLALLSRV